MRVPRPHIHLTGIQVKSLEKAQRLAAALNVIEEECGIHEVRITLEAPFICPWIDLAKLDGTDMERLLRGLLLQISAKSSPLSQRTNLPEHGMTRTPLSR